MNVYEIFTKISMTNGVSSVLGVIAKEVLGLEGGLGRLAKQFESINKTSAAVGGGLAIFGGAAGVAVVAKIAEHGAKLLDQQDKLQRSGIAFADVLKLQADYYERIAKGIPTSTASEYLRTVNELRGVTGSTAGAQALATKALMVDALLSNSLGREAHGEYYKLLRSTEMKGIATDPGKLEKFTDQAFSYITAFGGKLTPQDFQTFARRGGAAFINADLQKAIGPMAVLMADLGGQGAGTAAMTLHQFMTGAGTLSRQQFDVMKQAGLLNAGGFTDLGGRINIKPGGILGSTQYSGNEPGWIQDVLMPHLRAISGGDPAVLEALIAKIGRNRNTQKLIEMFGMPGFQDQIAKDLGLAKQVSPIGQAYSDFISRNPKGVKEAFGAQYESMMQAIGAPIMQAALPAMKAVTEMFTTIGDIANKHPEAMKNLGIALAGLGAGMIALGSVAVLGAMAAWIPGGIAAVAVVSIGGAITALAALKWSSVTNALVAFGASVDKLTHIGFDWLAEKLNALGDAIMGIVNKLKGWFQKTSFEGSGFGGGGGIINAAWSGGGGASSAAIQRMARGGGGISPEVASYIRERAIANSIDPNVALAVAGNEGARGFYTSGRDAGGDHGTSFGPFQLHYSGHGAEGDLFSRATGLNARDRSTWKAQVDWAMSRASKHGWSAWMGARDHGIGRWQGIHPHGGGETHIHVHLDGEVVHRSVVRRIVNGMTHPTTAPYHDGSRHFATPDAGLVGI